MKVGVLIGVVSLACIALLCIPGVFAASDFPLLDDQKGVCGVISFVVAILGIRYLTPDAVLAGVFSSSATVLALFIFVSFGVFFLVIERGVTLQIYCI